MQELTELIQLTSSSSSLSKVEKLLVNLSSNSEKMTHEDSF